MTENTWQTQHDATLEKGHDAINLVSADLLKKAYKLAVYRDAYNRAMWQNDYDGATDHLRATERVLQEILRDNQERLDQAIQEVAATRRLRQQEQQA